MSAYKGVDLFGSGPHRFVVGEMGQLVLPRWVLEGSTNRADFGSVPYGEIELDVTVRGRLVAASDTALWALVGQVESVLAGYALPGLLDNGRGRTWSDMFVLSFTPAGAVDRGRSVSLAYEALFRKIKTS